MHFKRFISEIFYSKYPPELNNWHNGRPPLLENDNDILEQWKEKVLVMGPGLLLGGKVILPPTVAFACAANMIKNNGTKPAAKKILPERKSFFIIDYIIQRFLHRQEYVLCG